jgi:hypothetical protein
MHRGSRLVAGGLVLAAAALGWWLARGGSPTATADRPEPASPASVTSPGSATPPDPAAAPGAAAEADAGAAIAPAHRIAEGGRLSVSAADLPGAGSFDLALDLPDVARGSQPRPVRIVSQDASRVLELEAAPLAGPGSGVSLAIDPGWLVPDTYLIEVTTAEPTHFPLRRYVLEVRGG